MNEYQPTTPRLTFSLPSSVRLMGRTVAGCGIGFLGVMLAIIGLSRILPAPMLMAYDVQHISEADSLYLYDMRHKLSHPVVHNRNIRNARWLPDGSGLMIALEEAWYVIGFDGRKRAPTESELIGTSYLPSNDWSKAINIRTGRLLLYNSATRDAEFSPLAGGIRLGLRDVVWSPNGDQLAVSIAAAEPSYELRQVGMVDVKSGKLRLIANHPAIYTSMVWSPDGTQLAYIKAPSEIYSIAAGTDAIHQLATITATVDTLAWSPTSDYLAFATRDGTLHLMNMQTHQITLLADNLDKNTELIWSPNGVWLAVSNGSLVKHDLFLLHVKTGKKRTIMKQIPANGFIAWQR